MVKVFSSLKEFDKAFPDASKTGERRKALDKYLSIGGVIKAHESSKSWPKLSYPSYLVLKRKLEEIGLKRNIYSERLTAWKKKYDSASRYHQIHQIKKLKEPIYWKHMAKVLSNPDYKKDAETVKLPVHLVADSRWKPMIKTFVNNIDYRKQLTETVSTSIVYKKHKKVAKYADELKDFRMETSGKKLDELRKKISELDEIKAALKELQKWAKE